MKAPFAETTATAPLSSRRIAPAPLLTTLAIVLAAWPVWRWFLLRLQDGGDEPYGLVPLLLALALLLRRPRIQPALHWVIVAATLLLTTVAAVAIDIPPLLRAALLLTALLAWARGGLGLRVDGGIVLLMLCALPVISSAQFYFGGPLRLASAGLATLSLLGSGLEVEREGVMLIVQGQQVAVDAPCSGIRLLWTTTVLLAALAAWRQWSARRCILGLCVAVALAVLANGLRAAALALVETRLGAGWAWLHDATGLCSLLLPLTVLALLDRRRTPPPSPPDQTRPPLPGITALIPALAAMLLALAPLIRETRPVASDQPFTGWPDTWDGMPLLRLPDDDADALAAGFPGRIARFRLGSEILILRWVPQPTRALHPAADCLRAAGWTVSAQHLVEDGTWASLRAERDGYVFLIRERIRDAAGRSWTDPSLWWWQADRHGGPWWSEIRLQAQ